MKESPEGHGMNGESVIMTGKNHVNTNIEDKVAKLYKVLFRDGCMYYKATDKKNGVLRIKMVVILEGAGLDELVIKR